MLNMVNSEDFVLSEGNQTLKAIYYIKHIPEMFRIANPSTQRTNN